MLKFSEILEFPKKIPEISYFERIRMVRMVRSLADRTFQLNLVLLRHRRVVGPQRGAARGRDVRRNGRLPHLGSVVCMCEN